MAISILFSFYATETAFIYEKLYTTDEEKFAAESSEFGKTPEFDKLEVVSCAINCELSSARQLSWFVLEFFFFFVYLICKK
jgi:hypothetical protein